MDRVHNKKAAALLLATLSFASDISASPCLEWLDIALPPKKAAQHAIHTTGLFSAKPKLERIRHEENNTDGHLDPSEHVEKTNYALVKGITAKAN